MTNTKNRIGNKRQRALPQSISGYNLNIVYRAGKKNPANASSHRPDYAKAPKGPVGAPGGLCVSTILKVQCNGMFCLQQLYAAAVYED